MTRDDRVTVIENQHNVMTIKSELNRDLYYVFDGDRKGLGLLQFFGEETVFTALTKSAVKALRDEIKDVYDVVFN